MDAYDIALLMANQGQGNPLKMRYGTVVESEENLLRVVPDGQNEATPAIKCCHPLPRDRVVLLVNGTEWLAVSVIGGEHQDATTPSYFESGLLSFKKVCISNNNGKQTYEQAFRIQRTDTQERTFDISSFTTDLSTYWIADYWWEYGASGMSRTFGICWIWEGAPRTQPSSIIEPTHATVIMRGISQ